MLATRIIPCLDVQNGRVVKGTNFAGPEGQVGQNLRDAGDPVERAIQYNAQGADEMVFLDITASHERRALMFEYARRVAEEVFIPFCVGGGIKTVEDFRRILKTGADKASINTAAVTTPDLISECARDFGAQCVVVAIDPKKTGRTWSGWEVHIHGGRTATGLDALDWAREMEDRGAGEIMLTSMDADGTLAGYDIPMTRAVTDRVSIPVIASGGAGSLPHIHEAVTAGGAQAALVSSIVHYGTHTVGEIKAYLAARNVPVRRI